MSRPHLPATSVGYATFGYVTLCSCVCHAMPRHVIANYQDNNTSLHRRCITDHITRRHQSPRTPTSSFVIFYKSFCLRVSRANYAVDHSTLPQFNFNCKFKIQICNFITFVNGHPICLQFQFWFSIISTNLIGSHDLSPEGVEKSV